MDELLRQGSLPRALVAIAGSSVGIGEIGESLGGLLEPLRGIQMFDRLAAGASPEAAPGQDRDAIARCRIDLQRCLERRDRRSNAPASRLFDAFSAKRVELERLLPDRLGLGLLSLEDLELPPGVLRLPEPHQRRAKRVARFPQARVQRQRALERDRLRLRT